MRERDVVTEVSRLSHRNPEDESGMFSSNLEGTRHNNPLEEDDLCVFFSKSIFI